MNEIKFSVITATFNAATHLPGLINSLLAQTDQDFEWVIADGASTDATVSLLHQAKDKLKNVIIDSRPDFGIYDALNRAIKISTGDYYVVIGADDRLMPDAVANYKKSCAASRADFVTAQLLNEKGEPLASRWRRWRAVCGQQAYISNHAVGLAIKKELHQDTGFYSRRFPIAADNFFILKAIKEGATIHYAPFVAGRFNSSAGTSAKDALGTTLETYRTHVDLGYSYWLQTIILILRLIRHSKRFSANDVTPELPPQEHTNVKQHGVRHSGESRK